MSTDKESEITRLTDIWMQIVCIDHHKDRDCHWSVEKVWSYGEPPKYTAYHRGYIGKEICETFDSYAKAQDYLYNELRSAIKDQIEWAQMAIKEPDIYDTDMAKAILKITDSACLDSEVRPNKEAP